MIESILRRIPVILNDCYGDPFFPRQVDNTIYKLDSLKHHLGPVGIITKMRLDDSEKANIKSKLASIYNALGMFREARALEGI